MSEENKYCVFRTDIQVSECQIWDKIKEICPNQVHMARFGMILCQNPSHMVWDASGMPPGASAAPWGPKGAPRGPKGAPLGAALLAAGWPVGPITLVYL